MFFFFFFDKKCIWQGEMVLTVLRSKHYRFSVIYRRSDDALYKKVSNVLLTFKNVTGLASNQQYYATTSAVYMGSNGREIESPESNRAEFETGKNVVKLIHNFIV